MPCRADPVTLYRLRQHTQQPITCLHRSQTITSSHRQPVTACPDLRSSTPRCRWKPALPLTALLLATGNTAARERPVTVCSKALLLAVFPQERPHHLLANDADDKPQALAWLPRFDRNTWLRSGSALVCVVVALDSSGTPQELAVSYPAGQALSAEKEQQIRSVPWPTARVDGQARPALLDMDVALRCGGIA